MEFAVGEEEWQYRANVYVVLNKPPGGVSLPLTVPVNETPPPSSCYSGYECSNKPSAHASIFELFPEQFQVGGAGSCQSQSNGS